MTPQQLVGAAVLVLWSFTACAAGQWQGQSYPAARAAERATDVPVWETFDTGGSGAPDDRRDFLTDIAFSDDRHGWTCGYGGVFATHDGGPGGTVVVERSSQRRVRGGSALVGRRPWPELGVELLLRCGCAATHVYQCYTDNVFLQQLNAPQPKRQEYVLQMMRCRPRLTRCGLPPMQAPSK